MPVLISRLEFDAILRQDVVSLPGYCCLELHDFFHGSESSGAMIWTRPNRRSAKDGSQLRLQQVAMIGINARTAVSEEGIVFLRKTQGTERSYRHQCQTCE